MKKSIRYSSYFLILLLIIISNSYANNQNNNNNKGVLNENKTEKMVNNSEDLNNKKTNNIIESNNNKIIKNNKNNVVDNSSNNVKEKTESNLENKVVNNIKIQKEKNKIKQEALNEEKIEIKSEIETNIEKKDTIEQKQEINIEKKEISKEENKKKDEKETEKPKDVIIKNKYVNDIDKNTTSIDIVNEIEQNLLSKQKNTNIKDKKVEIRKGEWNSKDVVKINDTDKSDIKKTGIKFKITTRENDKSKKVEELKKIAHKAAKSGEHEIAIKYYKEILKINPKDNFAKLSLATSYHALKQYNQAKVIYLELIEIFPEDENLVSNLISIMVNESPYEAVYLVPLISDKYTNSSAIQAQTSLAFAKVKNYKDAINYMKKAIYLDQNNKEYLYNLGVLYDLNGNYEDAITIYKKIVSEKEIGNFVNKDELSGRIKILSKEI